MEPQTGIYEFRQEEDAALLDDVKADIITYILIKKGVWCWWKGILLESDFQVLLEKTPAIPLFNLLFRDWLVILLKQMEIVFHKAETRIVNAPPKYTNVYFVFSEVSVKKKYYSVTWCIC